MTGADVVKKNKRERNDRMYYRRVDTELLKNGPRHAIQELTKYQQQIHSGYPVYIKFLKELLERNRLRCDDIDADQAERVTKKNGKEK